MIVNFYHREIFSKRLNSTKTVPADVAPSLSTQCTLKQPTNITNPQIIITFATSVEPNFFYCVIPELNRKYFVKSCESLLGNQWLFTLHVDVLGTYGVELSATTEYVLRAANAPVSHLIDNQVPIYADSTVQKIAANRIFTDQTSNGMYVVGLSCANAQGALSGGSVNYYCIGSNAMVSVMRQIFNPSLYYTGISISEMSEQLFKALFNPGQYIQSVRWFPFQTIPNGATAASSIDIGYWSFPVTNGAGIANSAYVINNTSYVTLTGNAQLPNHPSVDSYPFANYAPYSKRIIHYPPFGDISLDDPRFISQDGINASYYMLCDLISGQGHLVMFAGANFDTYVSKHSCQIGVPVAYTTFHTPSQELNRENVGKGVAAAAFTDIGNMFGGDVSTLIGKVGNGLLTSSVIALSGGSAGDAAQYADNPYIVSIFKNLGSIDVQHMGKPLMENRQLSTISGFCSCYDCDFVCPTTEETNELQSLVKSGFYAEWS